MTPEQSIAVTHFVIIGGVALVFLGVPLGLIMWQDYENRQRKKRYAAAKAEDDARWQIYLQHRIAEERQRQEALARQQRDTSPVSVPVTYSECLQRRRILRPEKS